MYVYEQGYANQEHERFQIENVAEQLPAETSSIFLDRGEDEAFLKSLLPHMRIMPPQQKMLSRIAIQETIYKFAYGGNKLHISGSWRR